MKLIPLPKAYSDLCQRHSQWLEIGMGVNQDGTIQLCILFARRDAPPGTGSRFMRELEDLADQRGDVLTLQTALKQRDTKDSPFKSTTSDTRLKKFYSRFGFRSNTLARHYHPEYVGNMNRQPMTVSKLQLLALKSFPNSPRQLEYRRRYQQLMKQRS